MSDLKDELSGAVKSGNSSEVKTLLECFNSSTGKKKLRKQKKLETLTHQEQFNLFSEAISNGHTEIVKLFLKSNFEVNYGDLDSTKSSLLHSAIETGNLEIVQLLIDFGADIKWTEQDKCSALYKAVRKGAIDVVKIILQTDEDIDFCGENGAALHEAIRMENLELVKILLHHGANIYNLTNTQSYKLTALEEAINRGNMTISNILINEGKGYSLNKKMLVALSLASRLGSLELVTFLLDKGVDVNLKVNGTSAIEEAINGQHENVIYYLIRRGALYRSYPVFYAAIRNGQINIVKKILTRNFSLDVRYKGKTPLAVACDCGSLRVAKILLNMGADVNITDKKGKTPLHYVAEKGSIKIVQALVEKGADINEKDDFNQSPLHLASKYGRLKVIDFLLDCGASTAADIDIFDKTPLDYAAFRERPNIAKLLLNGANLDATTSKSCMLSMLCYAIEEGNTNIVQFLLERGVSLAPENTGLQLFPVHLTVEENRIDILKMLLAHGASVKDKDGRESSLLHYAAKTSEISEMIDFLLTQGADINAKNCDGQTPLHYSATLFDERTAHLLIARGADFNIEDNKGETALQLALRFYGVFHAKKLIKAIVRTKSKETIIVTENGLGSDKANRQLKGFYISCNKEIEDMRKKKFKFTDASLYDIFMTDSKSQLLAYARIKSIFNFFMSEDYKVRFPIYASMLSEHFAIVLQRQRLLSHINVKNFFVGLLDKDYKSLPNFPDLISHQIFGYLSVRDLMKLKNSCRFAST